MKDFKPFRQDALDKVTGVAKYSADFHMNGMLHAKILWPSVPSARILKIDTSEAQKMPGVVRIITRKDITGPNISNVTGFRANYDRPILVGEGEVVKFVADALALVAARSEDEAERACDKIRVEYEELPAAHTSEQAKERGEKPFGEYSVQKGDVEKGFSEAAVIVEGDYYSPYGEHAYIEPEGGYAYVDNNGTITVTIGSQDIRQQQLMVCRSLDYPFSRVRLCCPYVGGGFGGKHSMSVHVYLALLAHVLKKPVRLVWTREESMGKGCKKQALSARIKLGLDATGKICALQARVDQPSGAYLSNSRDSLGNFCRCLCSSYKHENIDIVGETYYTTMLEVAAFRGVGAPDGITAIEPLLDKAAEKLKMSPLAVRQRNWLKTSEEVAAHIPEYLGRSASDRWIMPEVMDAAIAAAGPLPKASPGKKAGRGIANAMPAFAIGNTVIHKAPVVHLEMCLDKTMIVKLGSEEVGQGITGAVTRVTADAMGVDESQICVMLSDTHKMPMAGALGFSQAAVTAGNSILEAAGRLKALMSEVAREYLRSDDESIRFEKGDFYNGKGEKVIDWDDFAEYCYAEVRPLVTEGRAVGKPEDNNIFAVTPVASVVDVEVDEETGEYQVLQIITAHDIGKTLNVESARGQILGGAVMQMGTVVMEEFKMENGRVVTPSFAEYLIPTSMDAPLRNKAVLMEGNLGDACPEGAKGIGEHGLYSLGGALVNAIHDAIGVTILQLPITPERVLKALSKI